MRKEDLFQYAINLVSEITDITKENIMSKSRKIEYVDARYMIVYILHNHGLYYDEIAGMMKCTPANIRTIITNMQYRQTGNRSFRNKLKITSKYLENKIHMEDEAMQ